MDGEQQNKIEGLEYLGGDKKSWGYIGMVHKSQIPNLKATLALSMVERWGPVAGMPDGEDSAGRQKLRIQNVDELVDRACSTADMLVNAFKTRNWLLNVPAPKLDDEKENES